MNQDQIIKWTRRGIREPTTRFVEDPEIVRMTLEGIHYLGMLIMEGDPSYYNKRVSLSSNTHVFTKPTDNMGILRVWDLLANAVSITGATNASPIVITAASHGFNTNDIVFVHSVGGNTAANGTWKITKVDDNSFSLNGSSGNGAYTSGGSVYKDPIRPPPIEKKALKDSILSDKRAWYPRGNEIVVDDASFANDIIVDYVKRPTAISDIPVEFHMGLVAYNVINLIRMPEQNDAPEQKAEFFDKVASRKMYEKFLSIAENQINRSFQPSLEPDEIPRGIDYEDYL